MSSNDKPTGRLAFEAKQRHIKANRAAVMAHDVAAFDYRMAKALSTAAADDPRLSSRSLNETVRAAAGSRRLHKVRV